MDSGTGRKFNTEGQSDVQRERQTDGQTDIFIVCCLIKNWKPDNSRHKPMWKISISHVNTYSANQMAALGTA